MKKVKSLSFKILEFVINHQDEICWVIENFENIKGVVEGFMQILS